MTPTRQWSELLCRISQRDEQALEELYRESNQAVYGAVWRIVQDPWHAEETIQDVFHQVWNSAVEYRPEKGTPSAWLMTIARTRAIDSFRRTRKCKLHCELNENLAQPKPKVTETWHVRNAVKRLDPALAELVMLSFYLGYSHQEIADRTGIPLGTVKTRLRSAVHALRAELMPA